MRKSSWPFHMAPNGDLITEKDDSINRKGMDPLCRGRNQTNLDVPVNGDSQQLDLLREQFRLDSLETYVLVSVLTATSSRAALMDRLDNPDDPLLSTIHTLLLLVAALSTFSGIYATIVFSLSILYGKTALGMNRDKAYEFILERTSKQRVRGFQAFLASLLFFVVEIGLLVTEKVPSQLVPPVAVVSIIFAGLIAGEVQYIIENAAVIFSPRKDDQ